MGLELNEADRAEIQRIVARYPKKAAALLPVLHLVQDRFGHLSEEAQLLVAHTLDVAPTRVREVVTFYEMFHEQPEGQFHLELCTNISCHLGGADALLDHVKQRLAVDVGHQTQDGMFSLTEVECLASCGSGPMMKVGMDYYEQLTPDAVDALIQRFKSDAPALGGKPFACSKAGPHTGPVSGFTPRLPVLPERPVAAPVAVAVPVPVPPPLPSSPPAPAGSDGKPEGKASLPSFDPKVPKRE